MHKLSIPRRSLLDHLPPPNSFPGWLPVLYILPLAMGLMAKLVHSKQWFGDYQAVSCAGLKWIGHQPIYALNLQCSGMHASSYVYIPMIAQAAAFLEQIMGEHAFFWLYFATFALASVALVCVPFFSRLSPGTWREKLPFFVFLSGSAFMWGNIAVILHGMILVSALMIETAPWLLIAAIIVAAWVKPVFLTYLVIIMIANMGWQKKALLTTTGIAIGLAPTLIFAASGGDLAHQWINILSHFVYDVTPGSGFFGWMSMVGINPESVIAKVGYLGFASLLGASGLCLAMGLELNTRERVWLGLTIAALLIPRIMSQDIFLLAPGLIVIARKHQSGQNKAYGPVTIKALCGLALFGGLTTIGSLTVPLALLGFSLYLLWVGLDIARQRGFLPTLPAFSRARMATDS